MIYQIDYSAASSGKVVSMTKRRIRWRWGFANEKALNEGKVGVECRGFEHEVTLVWSITSGKKLVIEDGKEIHYGVGRRAEGKFVYSWIGLDKRTYTIVAFASPSIKATHGAKQFDLLIDGQSFHCFPRIFQLCKGVGMSNMSMNRSDMKINMSDVNMSMNNMSVTRTSRHSSGNVSTSFAASAPVLSRSEHRSDRESFRYDQNEEMQWAQKNEADRTMNGSTTQLPPVKATPQPQDLLSSPTESLMDMEYNSSPSLESASFWDSENTNYSEQSTYAPSQPPSYEAVQSSIMDAYCTSDIGNTENITPETTQTNMQNMGNFHMDTSSPRASTMNEKTSVMMESPKDVSDFDGVLKNLVNLDDISSSVLKGYTKETYKKNHNLNQNKTTSLAQLKSMHSNESSSGPTKEIMKTHQVYAANHPGALVVYGQPQQSYNSYTCNTPLFYGSA